MQRLAYRDPRGLLRIQWRLLRHRGRVHLANKFRGSFVKLKCSWGVERLEEITDSGPFVSAGFDKRAVRRRPSRDVLARVFDDDGGSPWLLNASINSLSVENDRRRTRTHVLLEKVRHAAKAGSATADFVFGTGSLTPTPGHPR